MPEKLTAFAEEASNKIADGEYKDVAMARSGSKEFARSQGIDQVDLIHFARLMETSTGKQLADTLTEAVKYNLTSGNGANAYGLSIYFPLRRLNKVDSITNTYEQIGMDDNYTYCIRKFAQMETSGQAVAGGTGSPLDSLFGTGSGNSIFGSGSSGQDVTTQALQQLIGTLLSGRMSDPGKLGIEGLDQSNTAYLSQDPLDAKAVADYIAKNHISADDLKWKENKDGKSAIILTEDQWDIIETADMGMFYDDGNGYVELGLDNIYDFDDDGNLLPNLSRTWLSIDGQPVAYYHMDTVENGEQYQITGWVPVRLNDRNARLILSFTDENEQGRIVGASYDYDENTTETEAKNLTGLQSGDKIRFLCDRYSYKGNHTENQFLGSEMTVSDPDRITITNTDVGKGNVLIVYKFTDIYGQDYWTPPLRR